MPAFPNYLLALWAEIYSLLAWPAAVPPGELQPATGGCDHSILLCPLYKHLYST